MPPNARDRTGVVRAYSLNTSVTCVPPLSLPVLTVFLFLWATGAAGKETTCPSPNVKPATDFRGA